MRPLYSRIVSFVPFAGSCLTVAWWDRVTPRIFGLPFNFVWLMAWMGLTSLCLALAYRIRGADDEPHAP
jgi:hypothetical protein